MIATMLEVQIDLNVRCGAHGQLTFAGFDDVRGEGYLDVGSYVLAVEPESGLAAPAVVVGMNKAAMLVYLAVAWREMKDRVEYPPC